MGTVYGAGEPPIVSTGGNFISFLFNGALKNFFFFYLNLLLIARYKGYHGNEADLNCDCTILIKDHDSTETIDLPIYLEVTSNLSVSIIIFSY